MKICQTPEEAQTVPGVVHIEVDGERVIAYEAGDKLPDHCKSDEQRASEKGSA